MELVVTFDVDKMAVDLVVNDELVASEIKVTSKVLSNLEYASVSFFCDERVFDVKPTRAASLRLLKGMASEVGLVLKRDVLKSVRVIPSDSERLVLAL
ncbi:hypothetical protein [Vibrio barjaei]|uniref:hypothetical protein n=1 Tax=Vibrio barjaei TaxID=1676683 RepID=UPI00228464A3|nr:hypothetical protein [Vibrio barjaei]MCY9874035.1 hypothetical protein [Vibrio barjaei]